MDSRLEIALSPRVVLDSPSVDRLELIMPRWRLVIDQMTPGLLVAFQGLSRGGFTEDELSDIILDRDGSDALTRFYFRLRQLRIGGLIERILCLDRSPVATYRPAAPEQAARLERFEPGRPYVLSRFALLRKEQGELILESSLGRASIILHDPRVPALLGVLCSPHTAVTLAIAMPELPADAVEGLLGFLFDAGALSSTHEDGRPQEEAEDSLVTWNFHDLLFHSRSRFGRQDGPFGASFRYIGVMPPLPAVKPPPAGEAIELYRPDLASLAESDVPLTSAMETRVSVRSYGDHAITIEQLGAFLFRVARVRRVFEYPLTDPQGQVRQTFELSSRPYPSGGATYDLELYLTVDRCQGLASGMYHYEPVEHRLTRVRERDAQVDAMLRYASISAAIDHFPQVLITLASRFQRLSWKYDAIAYATTLKNVGVLYQTMYLVATAMGLAPCALGSGDADLFAQAAGTDYYEESSVGEFMLGSLLTQATGSGPKGGQL